MEYTSSVDSFFTLTFREPSVCLLSNVQSGFILTSCALVHMHILACLAISIFSCTPLGVPLSLQGRPASVICPRGSRTRWINMSLILLPLHLSGVKVCIYTKSKSIYNQSLFLRIARPTNTTKKANRTAPRFLHVTGFVCLIVRFCLSNYYSVRFRDLTTLAETWSHWKMPRWAEKLE